MSHFTPFKGVYGGTVAFFGFILIFLIGIPFILLSIYNIDCLTTGGCNIWSWVVSILSIIGLFITTILMIVFGNREEEKDSKI
jgi:uncharacterized membrane protein (DUF485 family)